MPSLSVVHTVPSFFKNDAPALSSPPIPIAPSNKSCEKYLKPTGTSKTGISTVAAHLSIIVVHTTVFPMPLCFQPRVVNKYRAAKVKNVLADIRPLDTTTP